MVVIGIVLMLPGLCVLAYAQNLAMNWLMMLILLAGLSGVAMIWAATRNFRP
jgi:predicted membrane channel-forming protein YqfA (hemolysin III family)